MLQFNFGFLSICTCCLIAGSNGKFIAWPFDLEGFFCSVLIRIWVGHHSKTLKKLQSLLRLNKNITAFWWISGLLSGLTKTKTTALKIHSAGHD